MIRNIKLNALLAAVLILIGTLFKISHWPGANVILTVGLACGVLLFILIISTFWGKLATGFGQFNGIFSSLVAILALLTFVFKLLHWPGAGKLIWVADIGILLVSASFLVDGFREKDAYISSLKIIAGFFILILALVVVLV